MRFVFGKIVNGVYQVGLISTTRQRVRFHVNMGDWVCSMICVGFLWQKPKIVKYMELDASKAICSEIFLVLKISLNSTNFIYSNEFTKMTDSQALVLIIRA